MSRIRSVLLLLFLFYITLDPELGYTKVYEPSIRALLGTASQDCEAVVPKYRTAASFPAVVFGSALERIANNFTWFIFAYSSILGDIRLWVGSSKRHRETSPEVVMHDLHRPRAAVELVRPLRA